MLNIKDIEKLLNSVSFQISAATFQQCPTDTGKEIAFAGRSNAGKSSTLNTLCNQKQLAKSSKTPGRTQLINFFACNDDKRLPDSHLYKLVDLPGYGYAKVADQVKKAWQKELSDYLAHRKSLVGLVLLMDIRHPLQAGDLSLLQWALDHQKPCHVVLTKSDKLKRGAAMSTLHRVADQLTTFGGDFSVQTFSSLNKEGLEDCYQMVGELFDIVSNEPEIEAPLD